MVYFSYSLLKIFFLISVLFIKLSVNVSIDRKVSHIYRVKSIRPRFFADDENEKKNLCKI